MCIILVHVSTMKVGKAKGGAFSVEFNCWFMSYLLKQKITFTLFICLWWLYLFSENIWKQQKNGMIKIKIILSLRNKAVVQNFLWISLIFSEEIFFCIMFHVKKINIWKILPGIWNYTPNNSVLECVFHCTHANIGYDNLIYQFNNKQFHLILNFCLFD